MREILPGVWHWAAEHPEIHHDVSSYYLEDARAVLDPQLGDEGIDALADRAVEQVILTNRLHGRDTAEVVEAFGARVRVPRAGLDHFSDRPYAVEPYSPGDEIAPGVEALALAAISPDDGALHIHAGPGALHFADGLLLHEDGELSLMADELMDDPEAVARKTFDHLQEFVELDFEALLFAHSEPLLEGGRDQLAYFVRRNST